MSDVLDRVSVSPEVLRRWREVCERTLRAAEIVGLRLTGPIPTEQAQPMPDGSLRIWVDAPGIGHIEVAAAPHEWAWMDGRN